jgi:hypothetical protein
MEPRQTTAGIPYSLRERYTSVVPLVHYSLFLSVKVCRKPPPSPVLPLHFISSDMLISPSIIPSHSASSANSTGTLIQRHKSPRNRPVGVPSPTTAGSPYSFHERYSSVFYFSRSPLTFLSVSKISGNPLLRPSFYVSLFRAICWFPRTPFRPILLRLRTALPENDQWTFLLQHLQGFLFLAMNITRQFFVSPVHHSLFSQCQIFQKIPSFAHPSTSEFYFEQYVDFPIYPFCFVCE